MNLNSLLIDALKDLEFEKATEIQQKSIPIALKKIS